FVDVPSQEDGEDDEDGDHKKGGEQGGDAEDESPHERNRPECQGQPTKAPAKGGGPEHRNSEDDHARRQEEDRSGVEFIEDALGRLPEEGEGRLDRKSTRLNSSHV